MVDKYVLIVVCTKLDCASDAMNNRSVYSVVGRGERQNC